MGNFGKISAALVLLAVFAGCNDYGLSPLNTPVITGQVHFIGSMPDNAQYGFVVVALDRPPNDELDITYLGNYYQIPDSILHQIADTTIDFRIEVGTGTYNWIFVAVIGNPDSVGIWNVVGEYRAPGDTVPTPITVDWGDSIWIEMTADLRDVRIP